MTQKEQVLEALRSGPFTQLEAVTTLGVLRLSERIRELAKDGYIIEHIPMDVTNRFGKKCRVMLYKLDEQSSGFTELHITPPGDSTIPQ
jgi:hypothetical protein